MLLLCLLTAYASGGLTLVVRYLWASGAPWTSRELVVALALGAGWPLVALACASRWLVAEWDRRPQ